jgi:hypothetical protein
VNDLANSAGRRGFVRRLVGVLTVLLGGATTGVVRPIKAIAAETPNSLPGPGMDNWIGEIVTVPYTFAPRGFVFCEGQELPISQNQSLYALIGDNYGGDGRTTFKLPDTRPLEETSKKVARVARPPFRHAIALIGTFPSRA